VCEPGALHDGQCVGKLARNRKKESKRTYHRLCDAVGVSSVDSGHPMVKCRQWTADGQVLIVDGRWSSVDSGWLMVKC